MNATPTRAIFRGKDHDYSVDLSDPNRVRVMRLVSGPMMVIVSLVPSFRHDLIKIYSGVPHVGFSPRGPRIMTL